VASKKRGAGIADVEFGSVMTPVVLRKAGLADVGKKWTKAA
jgi:hypothetical protein